MTPPEKRADNELTEKDTKIKRRWRYVEVKKVNLYYLPQTLITNIILKTADPITPLMPISSYDLQEFKYIFKISLLIWIETKDTFAINTPITAVASSGAEDPAKRN